MIFTYKKWDDFCGKLNRNGFLSIPAQDINKLGKDYIVLKHDVETDVKKAYNIAKIEQKYGHRGSYYVQAYLLDSVQNIELLRKMQRMGHEISYHYDVLDSCHGNLEEALNEFERNKCKFEANGFVLKTVCQHGNPVIERNGYHSNRDFFRNKRVQMKYPQISDIMVNYKENYQTEFIYFSDAGRQFKMIFDPLNNDIVNSDNKNKVYRNLDEMMLDWNDGDNLIISMHPHRWTKSAMIYCANLLVFKGIRCVARLIMKNSAIKKIMSKYYYLAKKI